MLNGIDIASFQRGIDLTKVSGDFAIVKATQGANYDNPEMSRQINSALKAGKLIGLYHYANGAGMDKEVDNFLSAARPYIGTAILVLDRELGDNHAFGNESYAKQWLDAVKHRTGVTPMLYISQSVCRSFAGTEGITKYPLWVAQYGSTNKQYGYTQSPWKSGSVSPWKAETIRQYSSSGVLEGWGHLLDLDLAYIGRSEWEKMAKPAKAEEPKTTITEVTKVGKTTYQVKAKTGKTYTLCDVSYGDKGEEVRFLQQLLTAAGYPCTADGEAGKKTIQALANYQADHKRTTCGKGTWQELLS